MWEEYYSVLDQLPNWLRNPVPFIVEALPLFKKHSVQLLLDLGCDVGRNSVCLAKESFDVVAIEISRSALKKTKALSKIEAISKVTVLRVSMTNLPFTRQVFHVVISVSVIHHALKRDIQKAIEEIHTVLKDNGFF